MKIFNFIFWTLVRGQTKTPDLTSYICLSPLFAADGKNMSFSLLAGTKKNFMGAAWCPPPPNFSESRVHKGKGRKMTYFEDESQRTVEDEVQFLLTLSRGCEEDPVADGLLDPVDETVGLPLHGQVLLCVCRTDGRLPAQDTDGAGGLAADGHRLPEAHHHPGGLEDEGAALTGHWHTEQQQQCNEQTYGNTSKRRDKDKEIIQNRPTSELCNGFNNTNCQSVSRS